jgi:hypothetical protein
VEEASTHEVKEGTSVELEMFLPFDADDSDTKKPFF